MTLATTWLGTVSNAWQDGQNWSNGAPVNGSGVDAVVSTGSSDSAPFSPVIADTTLDGMTLTLSGGDVTLNDVTLGGAAGAFVMDVPTASQTVPTYGTLTIINSATLANNGSIDIAGGLYIYQGFVNTSSSTFENDGNITGTFEYPVISISNTLVNNGVISGLFDATGGVSGSGTIDATPTAGAILQGLVAATQTIDFQNKPEQQVIISDTGTGQPQFLGSIVNMVDGDQIFVQSAGNVSVVGYNGATLDLAGQNGDFSIAASGAVTSFQAQSFGPSTTILTAACYAAGTRLRAEHGDRPIEDIRPGDTLLTVGGPTPEWQTVRWVGRSRIDLGRHPRPAQVAPIRVRAGAFADGVPARDLLVSPDHALLVGGVLMPAGRLCNGATIVREPARGHVTYFHVEFDQHTLVLAEGLAAESYLDTGNRAAFDNAGPVRQLHPEFGPRRWDRDACRPLVLGGAALVAAHAGLLARAEALGYVRDGDPAPYLVVDGRAVVPAVRGGGAWRFRVPAGARDARLRSRHHIPAEHDAGQRDHRQLGLPVIAIRADGAPVPLAGAGWHQPEEAWCWTDGDAALALPDGAATVELRAYRGWARYWIAPAGDAPYFDGSLVLHSFTGAPAS